MTLCLLLDEVSNKGRKVEKYFLKPKAFLYQGLATFIVMLVYLSLGNTFTKFI